LALVEGVVMILTDTAVDWFGLTGLKVHVESVGKPEQVYVKGITVVVLPPLVAMKLGVLVLVTVRFTFPVAPCLTDKVPDARFEVKMKVSFEAVTVKPTVVVAEPPEVPVTVTLTAPAATFGATEIVTVVDVGVAVPLLMLMLVGLKLHETPLGGFVQLKLTLPVKFDPLFGVTVITAVKLPPATTVVGVIELADSAN
jgi:hypothetical protein